jgi:hypothetical protein
VDRIADVIGPRSWLLGGAVVVALVLNLLDGAAFAAAPAQAPAPRDVATARRVLRALTRYDLAQLHRQQQSTAAAKAVLTGVQSGCPHSLPLSLGEHGTRRQRKVIGLLDLESVVDVYVAAAQPVDPVQRSLAGALGRVHFTDRAFSRSVHLTAKTERMLAALKLRDVCRDIKTASEHRFAVMPRGVMQFGGFFLEAAPSAEEPIDQLPTDLRPDLTTPRDRAAITRYRTVHARYNAFEGHVLKKWGPRVARALIS